MAAETIEAPIEAELTLVVQETATVEIGIADAYWRDNAACGRTVASDLTPEKRKGAGANRPNADERYVIATFCGRCTVREDCLADSLRQNDRLAIRGGLLAGQRKELQSSFDKHDGFVAEDEWEKAIETAASVREQFLQSLNSPLVPTRKEQCDNEAKRLREGIVELLHEQPDKSFATGRGKLYPHLAERFNTRPARIRSLLKQMTELGLVERMSDPDDQRYFTGLKLVS